jgi:hypothetical protein
MHFNENDCFDFLKFFGNLLGYNNTTPDKIVDVIKEDPCVSLMDGVCYFSQYSATVPKDKKDDFGDWFFKGITLGINISKCSNMGELNNILIHLNKVKQEHDKVCKGDH